MAGAVGSLIDFAGRQWLILDESDSKMLITTKDIAFLSRFHSKYVDVTWADSEIRAKLNTEFYQSFADHDKKRIVRTDISTPDNPWFGANGGADTSDYVFLLSIEEAVGRYFGDSADKLLNRSPKQNYWFQRKDKNNPLRMSRFEGAGWWWWLRSMGKNNKKAAYIHDDGNIGIQGNNIFLCNISSVFHPNGSNLGGVRPCMWIEKE
ncbi:MAG: DUF6273 domain-containing protein [Clostridiales bacterium]|jgi:hypothetical protein|nr:DUF6273 domain-containing protein [Clostridiales bacterium]